MTVHSSKGLEYKAVIVPYTDWRFTEEGDTIKPTGDYGSWSFKGKLNVYASEVSANSPYGMTITIANTTAPVFAAKPAA